MAWWSIFVQAGIDKYNQQKDANKRERDAKNKLDELNVEYAALESEESGISAMLADRRVQLADRLRPREYKPLHTAPGRYNKYLRGRRRGAV